MEQNGPFDRMQVMNYSKVSDEALIARARALARDYQAAVAELVAVIAEIERRKLHVPVGCSSTFDYCVRELQLSEDDAAKLLRSARVAKRHPEVLSFLSDGTLTARAVSILSPEADKPGFVELLDQAKDQPLRTVERLVAERNPAQLPREETRLLGTSVDAGAVIYRLAFNADETLKNQLDRLKDLLSHRFPSCRLEDVVAALAQDYLASHDPVLRRAAERRETRNPKARRVPPSVRDAVWRRDGGRCAYIGLDGNRCDATRWLELDHIEPWALGGKSDDPANIRLLCREHNQWEARRRFGDPQLPGLES